MDSAGDYNVSFTHIVLVLQIWCLAIVYVIDCHPLPL